MLLLDQSEVFSAASPTPKLPVLLESTTPPPPPPEQGLFWGVKCPQYII